MASTISIGLLAKPSLPSHSLRTKPASCGLKPSLPRYTSSKHCNVHHSLHGSFTKLFCAPAEAVSSATDEDAQKAVELLTAVSDGKATPGGDIIRAMSLMEKKKIKYATEDLEKLIGGEVSPGRAWRLVFVAESKPYQAVVKGERDQGGYMFPLTAVQTWDAATKSITNSVILGFIASIKFSGGINVKGNMMKFTFNKLNLKLGPAKFSFDVKEQEGFFVFLYANDDIIVARGQGGGTALWRRPSPAWLAEKGVVDGA